MVGAANISLLQVLPKNGPAKVQLNYYVRSDKSLWLFKSPIYILCTSLNDKIDYGENEKTGVAKFRDA